MRWLRFVVFAIWLSWVPDGVIPSASAASPEAEEKLIQALKDPNFKIRLQSAILLGKHKIIRAAPELRRALNDADDSVRAAVLLSLGKIGDQQARIEIVKLLNHPNGLVSQATEKALILLDQALGKPRYLVVIDKPRVPQNLDGSKASRLLRIIKTEFEKTTDLVLSAGEEQVLVGGKLEQHLTNRSLTGILIQPKIVKMDQKVAARITTFRCKVSVMTLTLIQKRLEHHDSGIADAEVEAVQIPTSQRAEIENTVLDAAVSASAEAVISYLKRRTGP